MTYDCPRVAKTGAALALGPRVSVARTHVLPTLRRIWWLAGRQQAAPLPGERQTPAMLVSRVGSLVRDGGSVVCILTAQSLILISAVRNAAENGLRNDPAPTL